MYQVTAICPHSAMRAMEIAVAIVFKAIVFVISFLQAVFLVFSMAIETQIL